MTTCELHQQWADELYDIKRQITKLKDRESQITGLMKEQFDVGDHIQATNGVQYVLSESKSLKYSIAAGAMLVEMAPDAAAQLVSVTESKLNTLAKKGLIDRGLVAHLSDEATESVTLAVRPVVPVEAKVVA